MTLTEVEIAFIKNLQLYPRAIAMRLYEEAIEEVIRTEIGCPTSKYEKCLYGRFKKPHKMLRKRLLEGLMKEIS